MILLNHINARTFPMHSSVCRKSQRRQFKFQFNLRSSNRSTYTVGVPKIRWMPIHFLSSKRLHGTRYTVQIIFGMIPMQDFFGAKEFEVQVSTEFHSLLQNKIGTRRLNSSHTLSDTKHTSPHLHTATKTARATTTNYQHHVCRNYYLGKSHSRAGGVCFLVSFIPSATSSAATTKNPAHRPRRLFPYRLAAMASPSSFPSP